MTTETEIIQQTPRRVAPKITHDLVLLTADFQSASNQTGFAIHPAICNSAISDSFMPKFFHEPREKSTT
jgi:hypothetical protein